MDRRYRLGAVSLGSEGIWFNYENAVADEDFEKAAEHVLQQLNTSDTSWITSLVK
ncbi:hypothetical protein [Peribacillus deserti]|nr:hypothetical protein [Peribacillus deserti]